MEYNAFKRVVLITFVLLTIGGTAKAQDVSGQEVNTVHETNEATIDYYRPRIAAAPDGSFAVAWEAFDEGQFVSEWKIAVQRYDANGSAIGPLNYFDPESGCLAFDSWLSDGQQNVELMFDTSGLLLVLMEHFGELFLLSEGHQSSEITLGVVDQNGSIVDQSGSNNCVQRKFVFPGANEQDRPRMVLLPAGLAVVMDGFFGGTDFRNVGLQFFDLSLNTLGDVVIPHDDANSQLGFHSYPDVATNGSLLAVAWHECPFVDPQGNTNGCDVVAQFAQISGSTLTAIGANVQASAGDPAGTWSTRPSVAMSPQGNSVIVWQDTRNRIGGDVFGQRFDAAGSPIGSNFQISQDGSSLEYWPGIRPEVAMANDGAFTVVWADSLNGKWRAFGRQYDAAGQAVSVPRPLASGTDTDFGMPAVATDGASYYYTGMSRSGAGALEIFVNDPRGNVAVQDAVPDGGALMMDVYPNPVGERATIGAFLPKGAPLTIEVADLLGRIVYRNNQGFRAPGAHELELNTAALPAGLYLVRLAVGGQFVSSVLNKIE